MSSATLVARASPHSSAMRCSATSIPAVIPALDRPTDGDHRTDGGHASGEGDNRLRLQPGDCRGPRRVLRAAVCLAEQVGAEPLKADAMTGKKRLVVKVLRNEHMRERQHDGGIGVGARGKPFAFEKIRCVVAHGTDIYELHAVALARQQVSSDRMAAQSAGVNLDIFHRHAAEHHDQPAMLRNGLPVGVAAEQPVGVADHARQNHFRGTVAVGVDGSRVAAERIQEAMQLALGVVKAACASPSVGAAEDRFVAVNTLYPRKLGGDEVQRRVPGDLDERFSAATFAAGTDSLLEIRKTDGRAADPRGVGQRAGNGAADR